MSDIQRRSAHGGRVPTVLFWVGVVLAPLAGLLIWFAQGGGALRAAAVLAVLGTVLIGLSVVLRHDSDNVRLELQENLLAETEAMRADVQNAMTTALQRSNQSLHAELAALQEQLDKVQARDRSSRPSPRPAVAGRPTADAVATTRKAADVLPGSVSPAPRRYEPPAERRDPVRRNHRYSDDEDEPTGYGAYQTTGNPRAGRNGSYAGASSYRRSEDYPAPAADYHAPRRSRRHRAED